MTCYPLIKTEMFAKSAFGTKQTVSGLTVCSERTAEVKHYYLSWWGITRIAAL